MPAKGFLDWMPVEASEWAGSVDRINNFITYVSVFCTIAITGVMLYFAWRYRRRTAEDKTTYITHNAMLETVWTVVPTIICVFVFAAGFKVYEDMREPPANALEINVSGRQWAWSYVYPNGKTADNDLVVPVGKPVKLIMKSTDVIHSFFVPAMRVKEDVIKSDYHYMWFTPIKTGKFHIFCAEYCGKDHSMMTGYLNVVSEAEYIDFVNDRKVEDLPPEELGKKLYTVKGCNACHSLDGSQIIGPTFKGVFGRTEELEDGSSIVVDENYIRESILEPEKKRVKGIAARMTPYAGLVTEKEIEALIAYLKTVK